MATKEKSLDKMTKPELREKICEITDLNIETLKIHAIYREGVEASRTELITEIDRLKEKLSYECKISSLSQKNHTEKLAAKQKTIDRLMQERSELLKSHVVISNGFSNERKDQPF